MAFPQSQMNDPNQPPTAPRTPPPYGPSANPSEIRADIDRTRGQMDHTLDMLRERLSPRNLLHEAMHRIRDGGKRINRYGHDAYYRARHSGHGVYERARHTGHDAYERARHSGRDASEQARRAGYAAAARARHAGHDAYEQARTHPVPVALAGAALVGAGAAWLLKDRLHRRPHGYVPDPVYSGSYVDARTGRPYDASYGQEYHGPRHATVPDPMYGESYVDARTGRPYDFSYGHEFRGQRGRMRRRYVLPTALAGAGLASGLAWMMKCRGPRSRSSNPGNPGTAGHMHSGSHVDARTGRPYDASYGQEFRGTEPRGGGGGRLGTPRPVDRARGAMQTAAASASGAASSARGAANRAWDAAKHRAAGASHAAGDWAHQARDRMNRAGHRVHDSGAAAWDHTRQRVHTASDQFQENYMYSREQATRAVQDYPLVMGAAALACGMLAGLAIPRTRQEDQWMGHAAGDVKRRAWETGREAYERGRQTAAATAESVSEEAERQGLKPNQLKERARRAASEAGRGSPWGGIKHQGLTPSDLKDEAKHVADEVKNKATEETQRHQQEMGGENQ